VESNTELHPDDERNFEPPKPPHLLVSQYELTRHYGGPEEGGWYYDRHQFIRLFAVTTSTEDSMTICTVLNNHESRRRWGRRH